MSEASPSIGLELRSHSFRRYALAAGACIALAHPGLTSAQELPVGGELAPPEAAQVVTPHIFELGSQDDSALASSNPLEVAKSYTLANNMGASWERIIIHPSTLKRYGWKQYDMALTAAHKQHFKMAVAIGLEGENWTDSSVKRYAQRVLRHVGPLGDAYAVGNEVNRPSMLRAMPGLSRPQTYRRIYQAMQPLIARMVPSAQVFYGEFSSGDDPVSFLQSAAACPEHVSTCDPIIADKVSNHPYQLTTDANQQNLEEPGIGFLSLIEREITSETEAGQLETPDHEEPKLALTEFGYWASIRGEQDSARTPMDLKERYMPDWERRANYRMALNIACNDPKVSLLFLYGMLPPQVGWKGFWDSSLVHANGRTTGTYKMVRDYATKYHEECVA